VVPPSCFACSRCSTFASPLLTSFKDGPCGGFTTLCCLQKITQKRYLVVATWQSGSSSRRLGPPSFPCSAFKLKKSHCRKAIIRARDFAARRLPLPLKC